MSQGSSVHEQCVTRCPVFRLVDSPARAASMITWKISAQNPGITILGSQLTGLNLLSYNRKVEFLLHLTKVLGFLQSELARLM